MNPPYEILLVSSSDDLTVAICEQFYGLKEFSLKTNSLSDLKLGLCLEPSPTFVLFLSNSLDSYTQELVIDLRAKLLESIFLMIYKSSENFEFPGLKIKAPFRIADLFKLLQERIEILDPFQNRFRFAGCEYNRSEKTLTDPAGHVHRLTEKEAAILSYLYDADGDSVSRETLLRDLWGYHSDTQTHTVETHVYRLRQKIEKDLGHSPIIITDQRGYRLIR